MLTSEGFKRKRYVDFFEEMSEQARELWGDDVNLSERSPVGKFTSLIAYARAEDNELAEEVYNSRFVDTSEGVSLENNVKRALITKKVWLKSFGTVQLNLNRGATVPAGDLFGTNYGVMFETLSEVKAPDDGIYTVQVKALEYGRIGNVEAGEITKIINPVVGLNSVTNLAPFRNGQDEETTKELQDRYYESPGKAGNRRVEAVRARVLDEVEGVRSCIVDENDTMEYNANGVPPKSFHTIVLGGEPEDVARKIFEAKPDGIRSYGSTVVDVVDSQESIRKIGFTYAETVQIYIKAFIEKGSNYPLDGDSQIKEQIVRFIGGTGDNVTYNGLGMSKDVVVSRLESRLFAVEGVEDVKVSLSTDGFIYLEENIEIGLQVAETDYSKIEVSDLVT
ncbi:baseplate J/gp47 family protein [Sporosarcina sp. FSL K6-1508]|uniref:baseplate J/gp47 family protein n=1 Tax=Sporosarcina sp. FSL K6-1508 TaxID=2921553 RepID=UPI0030FBD7B3